MQKVVDILRDRLTTLMELRKISGRQLADMAEIHPVTVSKILNGKMPQVSFEIVHKIAVALGITLEYLAGGVMLYPEHEQKILKIREQFEQYGYDSAEAVIAMIQNLSEQMRGARLSGQALIESIEQEKAKLKKNKKTERKKRVA